MISRPMPPPMSRALALKGILESQRPSICSVGSSYTEYFLRISAPITPLLSPRIMKVLLLTTIQSILY